MVVGLDVGTSSIKATLAEVVSPGTVNILGLSSQPSAGIRKGNIVDIEATRKQASDIIWSFRKSDAVKQEGKRILEKHVNTAKSTKKNHAKSKKTKPTQ